MHRIVCLLAQRQPIEFSTYIESFNPYVADGSNIINNIVDINGCNLNTAHCALPGIVRPATTTATVSPPTTTTVARRIPPTTSISATSITPVPSRVLTPTQASCLWQPRNGENIKGPFHCHGFVWGDNPLSAGHVYRENSLFYVSMYDHLTQRSIRVTFPGVPCALVSRMWVGRSPPCVALKRERFFYIRWQSNIMCPSWPFFSY